MHDHDESGASIVGQRLKERLQGVDAASGGADADNHRFGAGPFRLSVMILGRVPMFVIDHGATPALRAQKVSIFGTGICWQRNRVQPWGNTGISLYP
jgi:hypothetical protein